jgi:hypothetical protein
MIHLKMPPDYISPECSPPRTSTVHRAEGVSTTTMNCAKSNVESVEDATTDTNSQGSLSFSDVMNDYDSDLDFVGASPSEQVNIEVMTYSDTLAAIENLTSKLDWKAYVEGPGYDRKKFLLHSPFAIQNYVNDGDFVSLRNIMDRLCADNCTLRTRTIPESMMGKELFLRMMQSIYDTFPDYTLHVHSVSYNTGKRTITWRCTSRGTKVFTNDHEFLFNTIKYGSSDAISERLQQAALEIESRGGLYSVRTEVLVVFTLTSDRMCVKKIGVSANVLEVASVNPEDLRYP